MTSTSTAVAFDADFRVHERVRAEGKEFFEWILTIFRLFSSRPTKVRFKANKLNVNISLTFVDRRLDKNHFHFGTMGMSQLSMKNNAHYVWLVLVPRVNDKTDLDELTEEQFIDVMCNARRLAALLKSELGFKKVNIASISIAVPQLHVQIIGRRETDVSWPGSLSFVCLFCFVLFCLLRALTN